MLISSDAHRHMKMWLSGLVAIFCISAQTESAETKTLGFAVTKWNTAIYESRFMDECPAGLNPSDRDIWALGLSPSERRRLSVPAGSRRTATNFRGPNKEDVCVSPTLVKDPPLKLVQGKISFGMNLDGNTNGNATVKSCSHENFTNPAGEVGVDNQMYRLLGCIYAWRSGGHLEINANAHRLNSGLGMILIEITDVDDTRNDDDVQVRYYRGVDPFSLDSSGRVLPYSSYGIDSENGAPRYGDVVQGRIDDGILTTDISDVHLPFFGNYMYMNQLIKDMRLRLELSPDGSEAKGMVAGYYSVDQLYNYVRGMLVAFPNRTQYSCPGIYVAAHQIADGHPDPETGECTTLSSAFKLDAVAAFINHPNKKLEKSVRRDKWLKKTAQNR